ncbi:MAG TPA: sensor histidine kinase [Caulobacteraceae bacterium]|nr:sensor histidine kinase [Caulobacteraceae bacterium]
MPSLKSIDLPAQLAVVMPLWLGELLTAFICLAAVGLLRFALDALTPGVAPFVLLFPAALIATLLGGWRPGAITFAVSELWAWSNVIPPRGFAFKGEAQPVNLVVIAAAGAVTVAVAQAFRFGARREAEARQAKLAERDLMLRELDHRMKNNFQTVVGLIQMQLRRAAAEPVREALREAMARVISISEAHRNLYAGDDVGAVDMSVYLKELCANLADALFLGELVRLECRVGAAALDRDRAVAVGLIVNELVTNAAKHAFADGGPGRISVAFDRCAEGYRLVVEDDGKGLPPDFATRRRGLGRGLVEAFTRQAGGSLKVGEGPGARFEVDLAA